MRVEKDYLGEVEIKENAYYGISTHRALTNFNVSSQKVNLNIVKELVNIKKQAALVNIKLKCIEKEVGHAIIKACDMILQGEFNNQFVINRYQGGAGTSTNMNVNEVIANIALECIGLDKGYYEKIHPINHVNLHQSTNDVYPSAIKIACIKEIRKLADQYAELQKTFQAKETEYGSVIKLGRTQYMDAVPILAGQMFGAYAETFSRDRWRIYKVEERLRTINIGGTAIGTGINAPIKYTFMMTNLLQDSTSIGLSRAENLIDNTQNLDSFVEVSSLLKVAATSIIKIGNDLRFLASGPHGGIGEISLMDNQVGSSIMPGKVNPVILEMAVMNAHKVMSNDQLISNLVSSGNLELNAFVPMIGETLLESLELLTNTVNKFNDKCAKHITMNKEKCLENLEKSHSLITPLISIIGYDKASKLVKEANQRNLSIKGVIVENGIFSTEELDILLNPLNITKPGVLRGDVSE